MLFYISVFLIPLIVWMILMLVSKRKAAEKEEVPDTLVDVCAFCHREFPMNQLIEKEVGEYGRVYCFCRGCIEQLYREFQAKSKKADPGNRKIQA